MALRVQFLSMNVLFFCLSSLLSPYRYRWFQVVPARSRWFQLVPNSSSSFQLVPARSRWFRLVPRFSMYFNVNNKNFEKKECCTFCFTVFIFDFEWNICKLIHYFCVSLVARANFCWCLYLLITSVCLITLKGCLNRKVIQLNFVT